MELMNLNIIETVVNDIIDTEMFTKKHSILLSIAGNDLHDEIMNALNEDKDFYNAVKLNMIVILKSLLESIEFVGPFDRYQILQVSRIINCFTEPAKVVTSLTNKNK